MAIDDARQAAQALIAGAEPAQKQVAAAAEKGGELAGSGKQVKLAARAGNKVEGGAVLAVLTEPEPE